ncbi:hypothetical protein [Blastomonas aquatica]|uniref:Uncharacterized protein n=1 Tax=Blastomonas aquatica TaxID=1510276 RepID=A0ABQ1J7I9_9SPHN|nr:hypothetical protein [Blastomonas aquatica]GGB61681.1 hypothetical protein GCM10010833_15850 [Blastomonas aquatica]
MGVSDEEVAVFDVRPYGDIPYMAYINPIDQQIALSRSAADGGEVPCMREKMVDGEAVKTRLPIDQCVFMEPAKVWHGRWLNQYEHSVFCPTEADQKECNGANADIWLTPRLFDESNGKSYRISFIGRKTRYSGEPGGYGHLSSYVSEIIVDRVISIEVTLSPVE